jgi:hypothetical protein
MAVPCCVALLFLSVSELRTAIQLELEEGLATAAPSGPIRTVCRENVAV